MWLGEDRRTWDHFRVHMDVLRSGMGVYEFAAYCGLVAHAEIDTGHARPSAATLAGYFSASDRRMREAVGWLEEHAWIRVDRVDGKASSYYVLPPPTPERGATLTDPTPEPAAGVPLHDVPRTPERGADEQEPVNKNQENENPRARADDARSQFDDYFWPAYPARNGRKIGKAEALTQWAKLSLDDRRAALRGARNLAADVAADRTIAPDAHRWLRKRTWEDWQTPTDAAAVPRRRGPQTMDDRHDVIRRAAEQAAQLFTEQEPLRELG